MAGQCRWLQQVPKGKRKLKLQKYTISLKIYPFLPFCDKYLKLSGNVP